MVVTRSFLLAQLADFAPLPRGEVLEQILQGPVERSTELRKNWARDWAEAITKDLDDTSIVITLVEYARERGYNDGSEYDC